MLAKKMSHIAMLAALCIVLRWGFAPFPNIKPITAFFLVSLSYMELGSALLVMLLTMLGSSLIFGFSLVVVWQIVSFTVLMCCWRFVILPITRRLPQAIWWESILAGLVAFSYGFIISIPIAIQFGTNNILYWLNGLIFDGLHAVSTLLFYPVILQIIRRFYDEAKTNFRS
ncbi:hypothetical protein [Streptococcus ovis]|uniref:hypothetical protein n=1 Tax=Streptococcus ovis TaxID=82806 RepID=UPI00035F32A6|nr:hypothetical protein [Streptococcus ovis]